MISPEVPLILVKPVRGTTHLAIKAVLADMQRALQGIVQLAVQDGEVDQHGWTLDVDQMVWRRTPESEPVASEDAA